MKGKRMRKWEVQWVHGPMKGKPNVDDIPLFQLADRTSEAGVPGTPHGHKLRWIGPKTFVAWGEELDAPKLWGDREVDGRKPTFKEIFDVDPNFQEE